jgi:hypothetical protein
MARQAKLDAPGTQVVYSPTPVLLGAEYELPAKGDEQ